MYILRGVSVLGSGFLGIQNSEQAYVFVKFLSELANQGHFSSVNIFRSLSLQIIKNLTFEFLYDSKLNASQGFQISKQYPNVDRDYEAQKLDAIKKLCQSMFDTQDEQQAIAQFLEFIDKNQLFFLNTENGIKVLQEIDSINFRLVWKFGTGRINCYEVQTGAFINSEECKQLIDILSMILVGTCNIFPHHQNKDGFKTACEMVFSNLYKKPTLD